MADGLITTPRTIPSCVLVWDWLRRRLAQYYEAEEGEHAAVQVVIPTGTYRPTFVFHPDLEEERPQAVLKQPAEPFHLAVEVPRAEVPRSVSGELEPRLAVAQGAAVQTAVVWRFRSSWKFPSAVLGLAALLALAAAWWFSQTSPNRELNAFWAPIVSSKQPIYVYTGTIPVFEQESPLDEAASPGDLSSPVRVPEPPSVDAPKPGPSQVFSWGEGMLTGSVYADIRLAAFLNGYKRTPIMRSGANLPFMDLKGSPLILVGSFDNYWTRVVNESLPFYLDRGYGIRERDDKHRRWFNPLKAEMTPRMMEDYAIVFRVLSSKNGAPVLGIVGLSTCGTHAAADFVTDPAQMRALSSFSHAALLKKNVELVLRTSLVNCAPTSVEVIASKVW